MVLGAHSGSTAIVFCPRVAEFQLIMGLSGAKRVGFWHGFSHGKTPRRTQRSKNLDQSVALSNGTQENPSTSKEVAVVREKEGIWWSAEAGEGCEGGAHGGVQVRSGA
jgi:hypothetical protein